MTVEDARDEVKRAAHWIAPCAGGRAASALRGVHSARAGHRRRDDGDWMKVVRSPVQPLPPRAPAAEGGAPTRAQRIRAAQHRVRPL
jgi:hypothetical protein